MLSLRDSRLLDIFSTALSREVLHLLSRTEMTARELTDATGAGASSMRHLLADLSSLDVLVTGKGKCHRRGRRLRYRVDQTELERALSMLTAHVLKPGREPCAQTDGAPGEPASSPVADAVHPDGSAGVDDLESPRRLSGT